MIWQLKCSNILRPKNNSFVTVTLDVLTDIMLVDKEFQSISKGSMDIHMEE